MAGYALPIRQDAGSKLRRDLLVIALIVAALFVALIVREQGRTILSQKELIQGLFTDSQQLNAIRVRELAKHRNAKEQQQAQKPAVQGQKNGKASTGDIQVEQESPDQPPDAPKVQEPKPESRPKLVMKAA